MKTLLIALLAGSTLTAALPSLAQAHDGQNYGYNPGSYAGDDWNNGGRGYARFDEEFRHIWQGIQHGLSDGSYSRQQAWRFQRDLRSIQARAEWEQRQGRYDSGDIQYRLAGLHERMHAIHDRGHDGQRDDGYGQGYDQPYGQSYGNGYEDRRDNRSDFHGQQR